MCPLVNQGGFTPVSLLALSYCGYYYCGGKHWGDCYDRRMQAIILMYQRYTNAIKIIDTMKLYKSNNEDLTLKD